MMLPVIEALTTSVWCAWSAAIAMISSAALPNVAFRKPPSVGPDAAGQVLGGGPDQPGGRDQRDGGGDKHPDRRPRRQSSQRLMGAASEQEVEPAAGDHATGAGQQADSTGTLSCRGPIRATMVVLRFPEPVARPDVPGICSRPHKAVTQGNRLRRAVQNAAASQNDRAENVPRAAANRYIRTEEI